MKVKELIGELKKCNPEDLVVLSRDEEGNGFEELRDIEKSIFTPENEVCIRELTPELIKQGFGKDDLYENRDGQECVVLWP